MANLVEIIVKVDGTAARAEMAALEGDVRDSANRQQTTWDTLGKSMERGLGDAVKGAGDAVDSGLHDIEASTQDSADRQRGIWSRLGHSIASSLGHGIVGLGRGLSGIGSAVGGALSGGGSALGGALSGLGGIGSALGSLSSAGGGLGAVALVGLASAAVYATAMLFPLLSALTLVGAGFTAFAFLAKGTVSNIFTALGEHGKQLAATLKGMTPAERDLVKATEPLKDEFGKLQQAIQPYIITAFAQGIKILKALFPALKPLVIAAGKALDTFLKNIADWLKGPSGKKFIEWMKTEGPKAIAIFGRAVWDTIKVVGRALDYLQNQAHTARDGWDKALHWMANTTDDVRRRIVSAADALRKDWDSNIHGINNDIDDWRKLFVGAGHTIESIWNTIAGSAKSAAGIIVSAVSRISGAIAGLPGMGILGTIGSMASKLGLASGGIVGAALGGVHGGMRIVGEHGPEVVKLPAGSHVFSNPDTQRMLGGGGGGRAGKLVIELRGGGDAFSRFMLQWLRDHSRTEGGGDVQVAFGWSS